MIRLRTPLLALLCLSSSLAYSQDAELTYPTTNFAPSYAFNPVFGYQQANGKRLEPVIFTVASLEVPIYKHLSGGFALRNAMLEGPDPDIEKLAAYPTLFSSIELLFKTHYPFRFGSHRLAPYAQVTLGLAVVLNSGPYGHTRVSPEQEDLVDTQYEPSFIGVGPSGTLVGGVEYFPIKFFGIFAEAGLQAAYLSHRSARHERDSTTKEMVLITNWDFYSYSLTSVIFNAGIKIGL